MNDPEVNYLQGFNRQSHRFIRTNWLATKVDPDGSDDYWNLVVPSKCVRCGIEVQRNPAIHPEILNKTEGNCPNAPGPMRIGEYLRLKFGIK